MAAWWHGCTRMVNDGVGDVASVADAGDVWGEPGPAWAEHEWTAEQVRFAAGVLQHGNIARALDSAGVARVLELLEYGHGAVELIIAEFIYIFYFLISFLIYVLFLSPIFR